MTVGYHATPASSLPAVLRHGLVPRIGPRSRRAGEPEAAIYLFPDLETAGSCIEHWLVEEFHEATRLVLLRVALPAHARIEAGESYERICYDAIVPDQIEVITRDAAGETWEFYAAPCYTPQLASDRPKEGFAYDRTV